MQKKDNIKIVRSAVGSLPSIAIINELRRARVKVVGIDSDYLSVGFHFCDKKYIVPKGNAPKFLDEILRICNIERPDLILPGPEEEIQILSLNKHRFLKRGVIVLCPDYETVRICSDKLKTYKFFEESDISYPKIYNKKNVRFPCIIKPRFGRGGKDVHIARNKKEMNFYLSKIKNSIIQEFIEGTEYSIDIFSDTNGNVLSIVPRIRIKTESGISIKGITVYDKHIIKECERIAAKLKLIGPSCIQCIKNKSGIRFIEINMRFGGGSILSLKANSSIIKNLIRIGRRQTPKAQRNFKKGLMMLRYYNEFFFQKRNMLSLDSDL